MGYRSDIAFKAAVISRWGNPGRTDNKLYMGPPQAQLPSVTHAHANYLMIHGDEWKDDMAEHITITDDEISFSAEGWKWYDSYEDIKRFEHYFSFLRDFGGEEHDGEGVLDTAFVRIGEETNDIEEIHTGEGYDLLQVERVIVGIE